MKRTVLILAVLLLIGGCVLVFGAEGRTRTAELNDIPEADGLPDPVPGGNDDSLLLELSYEGLVLPVNGDGTVLIPVIPEAGLTVTASKDAVLSRSESVSARASGSFRSVGITAAKNGRSRTFTLTETHMPVTYITVNEPDVSEEHEPFGDKNKRAQVTVLSAGEDGKPILETGSVKIKLRGKSSRKYIKKGYTFTNLDENNRETARSFLGFPPDTKFGLNSMYEDDVKLRDILSLELWQNMLPIEKRRETIRMQYCELYINGIYWGLYAFQQVVSSNALGLSENDGLLKIFRNYDEGHLLQEQRSAIKTVVNMPDGKMQSDLLEALALVKEGNENGLENFDRELLFRYALFLQFTCAGDNTFKNMVVSRHADTGLFHLIAYDTDLTFALGWDESAPLKVRVIPEASMYDLLICNHPLNGLIHMSSNIARSLAELWFSLRKDVLTEDMLLYRAKELFSLVSESGAMERDRLRWPNGHYTDSLNVIETFIRERLLWCDDYFGASLFCNVS